MKKLLHESMRNVLGEYQVLRQLASFCITCINHTYLYIYNFNTKYITYMHNMFATCSEGKIADQNCACNLKHVASTRLRAMP